MQVAAAVIQIVDLSAVGQDGGSTVAVEVVVVADGFGNGQVQHIVLRIAPVGFGQAVSGVLFFGRHLPLVLGDELAVSVVVETGENRKGRLKIFRRPYWNIGSQPTLGRLFEFLFNQN